MDTNQLPAPVSPEQEDKDVVMFRESLNIFQDAPNILKANKKSNMGAKAGAQRILQKVAAAGGKMTAELDEQAKGFLIKVSTTLKTMKERREPFTQLATALSRQFTGLEAELDIASKAPNDITQIQGLRNDWAKFCIQEAERQRIEAERKAEIEKEKARLIGWVTQKIGDLLTGYLFNKRQKWMDSFNAIAAEGFDQSAENLKQASTAFVRTKLGEVLRYELPVFPKLAEEQINTARIKAHEDYDFDSWIARHDQEMEELKQSLIERLPALRQQFEEAAELARLAREAEKARYQAQLKRQQEEEAARKAEEQRQANIARANAQERKRLEAEAAKARQEAEINRKKREEDQQRENERLAALQAENDRLENEKLERERQEKEKLQREREAAEEKNRQTAELTTSSLIAGTLFDQAAASLVDDGPESRKGYEITVLHPAGWVQIFQFWYQHKGCKMAVDKMASVKLESMKTFCETAAKDTDKKSGERIQSEYLRYELDVKAVNRKEKNKEEA